jgi:hypothetical protein
MLRDELDGMVHVPHLQNENAAKLLLGFRIGVVGGCDFAVLPVQGQRRFRRLKSFSGSKMPVSEPMVVVLKALIEHSVLLVPRHVLEFPLLDVSQTDVFHCTSPVVSGQQRKLARWIVHPMVVGRGENRQKNQFLFQFLRSHYKSSRLIEGGLRRDNRIGPRKNAPGSGNAIGRISLWQSS